MADEQEILNRAIKALQAIRKDNTEPERREAESQNKLSHAIANAVSVGVAPLIDKLSRKDNSDVVNAIENLKLEQPTVNVPEPKVTVNVPPQKTPVVNVSTSKIVKAMQSVEKAVSSQQITFPEPIRHTFSKPQPVILTDNEGKPYIAGSLGGSKTAYLRGQGNNIASVRDLTSSIAAIDVSIVDGSGGQLTSFGGGTQYTEGDIDTSFTGTVMMHEGNDDDAKAISSTAPLPVAIGDGIAQANIVGEGYGSMDTKLGLAVLGQDAANNGHLLKTDTDGQLIVSNIVSSTQAALIDSSGVQYSGSNPLPIDLATKIDPVNDSITTYAAGGSNASVFVTGSFDSMMTYKAMTTNPTSVADGADVRPKTDDIGRALSRPVQVRDLMATAYVTETEIEEVTLLSGAASTYHDLVYVFGANESDAAISLDLRATKGGNVLMSISLPANGTAGVAPTVPVPASDVGASWTVKNKASDNSNTTYSVTGLFSKES